MARSLEERSPQGQQGSSVLAVRLHHGGLKVEEIETPSPDPGEVLVRVHAAAITRDELEWPVDRLPAIPSYELSGVVVDSGDAVYALTPFDRDGVAAEYAVVPAYVLAPKPLRLSHVEAAALPMGGLTAWQALFVHGRLARGERALVTGASGGVGHIAVQLARHAGATVVESGPVDLVFDTRGGEVPAGERVVTIAEETPGAIYFIVEADHEQLLELRTLADAGELRAEVDSVFPLTEARAAFERVAGLRDQRVEIAMMRTPDGHGRIELSRFLAPPVVADHRNAPVNALGYLRVMFAVDDLDDTLARLRRHGARLVDEVVQYEDVYRLCYVRGPEGILIGLAEQIG